VLLGGEYREATERMGVDQVLSRRVLVWKIERDGATLFFQWFLG